MREELCECPFCGNKDVILSDYRLVGNAACWRITCLHCRLTMTGGNKQLLLNLWNTRPVGEAMKVEVERLKTELGIQENLTRQACFEANRAYDEVEKWRKMLYDLLDKQAKVSAESKVIATNPDTGKEERMSARCSLCGVFLPDYCINDVEITYRVNDQIVLSRKRGVCPNCQSIIVQKITNSGFFPTAWDAQCHLIPYDGKLGEHCPDCSVEKGELHRVGCDWEKCPICGLQLISCGHCDLVPWREKGEEDESR